MSVEDSQCAAYVTGFDSNSMEIALSIVQGVVTVLSIVGSLLYIITDFESCDTLSTPPIKIQDFDYTFGGS